MKRQWGIGVGSASVLIIFVLLCLTVFATLSLVSAQADLRLAQRAAESAAAYYEADGEAVELYCAITAPLPPGSTPRDFGGRCAGLLGDRLTHTDARVPGGEPGVLLGLAYRVPVDENRAIEVSLSFDYERGAAGVPLTAIEGWRTVQTGGFAPEEETLTLWQGGLPGLPDLEGVS